MSLGAGPGRFATLRDPGLAAQAGTVDDFGDAVHAQVRRHDVYAGYAGYLAQALHQFNADLPAFGLGVRGFFQAVYNRVATLMANAEAARGLIAALAPALSAASDPCPEGCHRALDHALITAPEARDPALCARLDAVAGRVLAG